jgi:hypothetical protein
MQGRRIDAFQVRRILSHAATPCTDEDFSAYREWLQNHTYLCASSRRNGISISTDASKVAIASPRRVSIF